MARTDDAVSRARRYIERLSGPEWRLGEGSRRVPISVQERQERLGRHIPLLLDAARLRWLPSCPELDEPVAEAKNRAERMRAHNVRALWLIYQDQIDRGEVDERIRHFFTEELERRVWCEPDPPEALRQFLGLPKRGEKLEHGPRKTTAGRDFFLAAEIQEWRDKGDKLKDACWRVFDRLDGTAEALDILYLRKIYRRETKYPIDKRAVRAQAECRKHAQEWEDAAVQAEVQARIQERLDDLRLFAGLQKDSPAGEIRRPDASKDPE